MAKVLIVEDNERNLKLFKIIIKSMGYETFGALDGEEGIGIARDKVPDLILMDIQMLGMDGISALKALHSAEKTRNIPVIALTSYAMKGDRERLLGLGFTDYISKPIEKDSFIEVVEKTLRSQHGRE